MLDWDNLNRIEYLDYVFDQDAIKGGSLLLNRNLIAASLAIDTFTPIVECDDISILEFERNTPLYYYRAGRLRGVFYVQDIERVTKLRYRITAQSAIVLLDRDRHMGGIYTGEEAGEVLPDLVGRPITIKTSLAKQKLYGWLPIASRRANTSQALFALGAAIRTGLDGELYAAYLWDGLSGVVPDDDKYRSGASLKSTGRVTQVSVTEHQYIEGGDITTLFEGAAQEGAEITFDGPMYDLQAFGFSILHSGANYAVLSGGTGTLTGRAYVHNTRIITRSLRPAPVPKLVEFPDSTLVSLVNSAAVAQRVADYYNHHQTIEEDILYTGQSCGDRLQVPDPFDAVQTMGCLESAEITLSTVLKAKLKLVKGYVPPKMEEVEYFDTQEIIVESGQWAVPDGVTNIRAVLISGVKAAAQGSTGKMERVEHMPIYQVVQPGRRPDKTERAERAAPPGLQAPAAGSRSLTLTCRPAMC